MCRICSLFFHLDDRLILVMASPPDAFIAGDDNDDNGTLEYIDEHTTVFSAAREPFFSHLVRMLLTALHYIDEADAGEEEECQTGQVFSPSLSGNGIELHDQYYDVLDAVQYCCLGREGQRDAAEQGFIDICLVHRLLEARGEASDNVFLDLLLADVSRSANGVCLAEVLQVGREQLQMMNTFGEPQKQKGVTQQNLMHEQTRYPSGLSITRITIESFRVVTDDTFPSFLYYALEPLLCDISYFWLLNSFFANVPLCLIGTVEGLKTARDQLARQESSLQFLLSMETVVVPTSSPSFFSFSTTNAVALASPSDGTLAKKRLQEKLTVASAMCAALATDTLFTYLAEEWRTGIEALRVSIISAIEVSRSCCPMQLTENLDSILQLVPYHLAYRIVHLFQLPLVFTPLTSNTEKKKTSDKAMGVVTVAVGASFGGESLEEVEYFLQPSDTDHTATTLPTGKMKFTTRLYAHFHRLFVLLFRSCSFYESEVVVLPSTFFDVRLSPFVRAVHSVRVEGMLRCHYYALFDVLAEAPWTLKALVVLTGIGWAYKAREIFTQWLEEQRQQGRHTGLSCCIVFKEVGKEGRRNDDSAEGESGEGKASVDGLGEQPLLLFILQHIVAGCDGLKLAVLVPAPAGVILSRQYGLFPLHRECRNGPETAKTTFGMTSLPMADVTTQPVFASLLQNTIMPVISYSVCGGAPLSYLYNAADIVCKNAENSFPHS